MPNYGKKKEAEKSRWKQWPASLLSATTGGARKPPGPIILAHYLNIFLNTDDCLLQPAESTLDILSTGDGGQAQLVTMVYPENKIVIIIHKNSLKWLNCCKLSDKTWAYLPHPATALTHISSSNPPRWQQTHPGQRTVPVPWGGDCSVLTLVKVPHM